jgi:hypothetical protein
MSQSGSVQVLSGRFGEDLDWLVTASILPDQDRAAYELDDARHFPPHWFTEHFGLQVEFRRDGVSVEGGGGYGGPIHKPGVFMDNYRSAGNASGLPAFVMTRVDPSIDKVVATTDEGTSVLLALSEVFPQFGCRFAAGPLPNNEMPGTIRAESEGRLRDAASQSMLGLLSIYHHLDEF